MIEFIEHIDSEIFLFFNGIRAPFFDRFMTLFTDTHVWIPMYIVLLLMIVKGAGIRGCALYIIALALAITLTDQTCATIIRPIAVRLRPSNPDNPLSEFARIVDDYRGGLYGFPSCHAANSFALAVFMLLFYRYRVMTFVMLLWALMNSYTRLYLGVHYPGDLLVGAIIGTCFGAICYFAAQSVQLHYAQMFCTGETPITNRNTLQTIINQRIETKIFTINAFNKKIHFSAAMLFWIVVLISIATMLIQSTR